MILTEPLALTVFRMDLLEALGIAASLFTAALDLRPVDRCVELSVAVLLASLSGLGTAGELGFMIAVVGDLQKNSQVLLIVMLCSTTDGGLTLGDSLT